MKKVVQILILGCLCVLGSAVELRGMEKEGAVEIVGGQELQQEEMRRKRAEQWEEKKAKEAEIKRKAVLEATVSLKNEALEEAKTLLKQLEQHQNKLYAQRLDIEEDLNVLQTQWKQLQEESIEGKVLQDIASDSQELQLGIKVLESQLPSRELLENLEEAISNQQIVVAQQQEELIELREEIEPETVKEPEPEITIDEPEPDGEPIKQVKKKPFPAKTVAGISVGVAAAVITAGAVYAGLKWYQRKRIARVIDKFDLELSAFSSAQKDAMAAAVLASSRVPGSMWNLKRIVQKGELATDAVSAEMMWEILAPLYYRKPVNPEDIQMLQERIQ